MGTRKTIEVGELHPQSVEQVIVARDEGHLLVVLNSVPYRIDLDRATALAWSLCSQIDAARGEHIEHVTLQRSGELTMQ